MKPSEVLRKAKALIDRPEKWWNGSTENNSHNPCASLALSRVTGHHHVTDAEKFLMMVTTQNQWCENLYHWNDSHTHPEVMDAFDRAIALAEKEEGGESDSDWATRKVAEVTRVKEAA